MSIIRSQRSTLDQPTKAALMKECEALMSHVAGAGLLYSRSIELDLFEARQSLREAMSELEDQRTCLDSMKELWPDGHLVFDRIRQGIDTEYRLINNAEDWVSLVNSPSFDIQHRKDNRKYQHHVSKNRTLAANAGRSFDKASEVLKRLTAMELPEPKAQLGSTRQG